MTKMTKGVSLEEMMGRLSPESRAEVEASAAELIAQEYALRAARKAAGKTQVAIAKAMGVAQSEVSRMESGGDVLLSTFGRYMQAAGFRLEAVAENGTRLNFGILQLPHHGRVAAPTSEARPVHIGGRRRQPQAVLLSARDAGPDDQPPAIPAGGRAPNAGRGKATKARPPRAAHG